jgi:hypothetical protein
MGMTLAEVNKRLELLKHKRAVWLEVVDHLSTCLDQEIKQAGRGIKADDCVNPTVPQPLIRGFVDEINENEIDPLNAEIEELENLFVYEPKEKETEDGEEKKGKSKTKQSSRATRGKGRQKPQGVRSIAGRAKQKSQTAG